MELKAIVRSLQHVISEFREMKDVLVVIHSSLVSINDVKSSFVMTVSGTYEDMPKIFIPCNKISSRIDCFIYHFVL